MSALKPVAKALFIKPPLCFPLSCPAATSCCSNYLISVLLGGRFNKIEQLLLWFSDRPALASSAFKLVGDSIDLFSREV